MKIIAGPCQHETLEHSIYIAKHCAEVCARYGIDYIFKASYDKANRSSIEGKRGIGIVETMKDFAYMKQHIDGLKILTDVHNVYEVHYVDRSEVVDVIQIPAFLCRQTDIVKAACETRMIVNIKKGQFLAPWDVAGILSKTHQAKEVWITERGTSFGYNTLVVDYTGLDYMLTHYNNVVFDVTHSVQKPGGLGTSSGGNREYVPGLARAASALGVQNFFIEVHTNPDDAPSDGPNMLKIEDFESVVAQIVKYNYKG
jgi:2-dehydro-3-deoxyphosphooctonate aldolase (KDO 8-P synthase)